MRSSCKNCVNLDMTRKEVKDGRLTGRFRYGCRVRKNGYICGFISDEAKLDVLSCSFWDGGKKAADSAGLCADTYGEMLQKLFDRWMNWKRYGCPSVKEPDGICLNRLRLVIEEKLHEIEETFPEQEYPECYYAKLPPVMAGSYMADTEQIVVSAIKYLNKLEESEDYKWLLSYMRMPEADEKVVLQGEKIHASVNSLRDAIRTNDHFLMKRESMNKQLLSELSGLRHDVKQKTFRRLKKKRGQIEGQMDFSQLKAS